MEKSILKAARMEVISMNSFLKEAVETMPPIIMLRNMHPSARADHAQNLHSVELITDEQKNEFPKYGFSN